MANIYDQASLVMIPSGTKTSKIFSQKPVNGDGDFTFSRSTAATRVNADGNIEKETQNLLLQSNSFDTTWFTVNASVTGGQSGYDGSSDAWLLENNSSTTTAIVQQPFSLGSSVRSFSVYAKAGNVNWLRLLMYDGSTTHQCWFNLTDGSTANASNIINAKSTSIGSGWYRCEISANTNITFTNIYPAAVAGSSFTDLGDNILIQDAQLEQGLVARDYIETTTAAVEGGITDNVPRLDYTDSSCPALLLEPSRTNVLQNSEYIHGWLNAGGTSSQNSTDSTSPEGLYNSVVLDASSIRYQTFSISSSAHSYSVYAKAKSGSILGLRIDTPTSKTTNFDLSNGTIQSTGSGHTASIEAVGNGWYRCIISFTDSIVNAVLQTTSSGSVYVWGAQLEAGSYATSYIPTYGTGVTRNAELAAKTSASALIGQDEGVVFVDFEVTDPANFQSINIYNNNKAADTMSTISIQFNTNTVLAMVSFGNGTYNAILLTGNGYGLNQRLKVAFKYKSGQLALYVNGVQKATSTATYTTIGTKSEIFLGDPTVYFAYKGGFKLYDYLQFPASLTNEELAALTTI